MILLKGIYDSVNKRLMIDFSCNLLKEHYPTLEKVIGDYKKSGYIQKNIETQKVSESGCVIIIPIDIPKAIGLGDGEKITEDILPKDLLDKITVILEKFRKAALDTEFGTTEFIPLTGYPLENLKIDIIEAIKNKRNFCIIDKYSEYEKFSRRETSKLRQFKVMYPSNDYSEVALYIYEGNMKSLQEQYLGKLEEIDWEE